ncbi:biotin--[acetyl-CoA-carboxylase] ligase [Pasteurellaceae bacterium 15-036681]|nr:biotin--[acetyl-CoA-carboxylase] ligase [Pasteurellaceae bacterium 15-036681]
MLLNQAYIQQALPQGKALVFDEIDSTNEYLLKHYQTLPSGSLCLAETQTAGRGRRGRQWYSPVGENLYFSMLWQYKSEDLAQVSALSLLVALVIAETFEELKVEDIQIKWPNDIYYQGKKMGGILNESRIDKSGCYLVIGIGLNLAMTAIDPKIVNQPWTTLTKYQLDRNELACTLSCHLQKTLSEFEQRGFAPYLERWQKFDLYYQQPVKLITDGGDIHGMSQGINEKGELLLERAGKIDAFAIGEISLRGTPLAEG